MNVIGTCYPLLPPRSSLLSTSFHPCVNGNTGITAKEQQNIFRLLSAVLWIGNLDFNEVGEKASISDNSTLDFVSNLLGVPAHLLKNALEVRQVETKHGGQRGTHYNVPLNKTQALAGRDGLAKAIYDRLFTISPLFSFLFFFFCCLSLSHNII